MTTAREHYLAALDAWRERLRDPERRPAPRPRPYVLVPLELLEEAEALFEEDPSDD